MSKLSVSFVTESSSDDVMKFLIKCVGVSELHIDKQSEAVLGNYHHTNSKGVKYYLNSKEVTLRGGKKQSIYYFSKEESPEGCPLPEFYTVNENPRNGFLTVRSDKWSTN